MLILVARFVALLWQGWCPLIAALARLVLPMINAVCTVAGYYHYELPPEPCLVADGDEAKLSLLVKLTGVVVAVLLGLLCANALDCMRRKLKEE